MTTIHNLRHEMNGEDREIDSDVEEATTEDLPLITRVGRLEGKVDLLAEDVRAVLKQTSTASKKLVAARALGAGVAGLAAGLAPAHADKAGKLLEAILSAFGG